jgi:hypothetical protein
MKRRERNIAFSAVLTLLFIIGSILVSSYMTPKKYVCEETGCSQVLTSKTMYNGKPTYDTQEECIQSCNPSATLSRTTNLYNFPLQNVVYNQSYPGVA